MKTSIKSRKHFDRGGTIVLYSVQINDLPESVFEQVVKLLDSQCSYDAADLVDDTKPTKHTYQPFQCRVTGVHLTRRNDETGNCAFCGVGEVK